MIDSSRKYKVFRYKTSVRDIQILYIHFVVTERWFFFDSAPFTATKSITALLISSCLLLVMDKGNAPLTFYGLTLMDYIIFARWFGVVSVILSLGILFNLEDARTMAKNMVKSETGYIMGGVLPTIFGTLSLLFNNSFNMGWASIITVIGMSMLAVGIFRVIFVKQWKILITKYIEEIPFLFSLFGLMFGVILLYIGFIAGSFNLDTLFESGM